jgi:hypothetical protein
MGGYILLSVKDNGLGLIEKNKKQLFSMFKRFHSHTEGTGIGLYIVKRIMDNAGGRVEAESTEKEGSEFKVFFKQNTFTHENRAGRLIVVTLIGIIVILSTHCQPVNLYDHALASTDSDGDHGSADSSVQCLDCETAERTSGILPAKAGHVHAVAVFL